MRFALAAIAIACASCDQVAAYAGPSDNDIRAALKEHYARADGGAWPIFPDQALFGTAKVAKVNRCNPAGSLFFCEVTFEMPDGQSIGATVDMTPMPRDLYSSGWMTRGPVTTTAAPLSPTPKT